MSNFICKNAAGEVVTSFTRTTLEQDLKRCAKILIENNVDNIRVSNRKFGDSTTLNGRWYEATSKVIKTGETAPELNQEIEYELFPDRNAHDIIYNSWIQRADFIIGIIENLDFEDQSKFNQKLMRDLSAAVRALVGDIFDLQSRVGELMQRVDNLEQYNITGDKNIHNLPGHINIENSMMQPLPSPPYYIGKELISDKTEQKYYHQGHTVGGIDGGLRRYYSAQESRGISPPNVSPLAIANETTGIFERYDQGAIAPDGGPRCNKGETRGGFAETADCSGNSQLQEFPVPVVPTIPIFTTAFYAPQFYNTGVAIVSFQLQSVLQMNSGYINGRRNEVHFNPENPLCNPPDASTPKCIPPLFWDQPFVTRPPYPSSGPCGNLVEPCI